ncbi:MAG TPA: hypothetical protein DCZ43_05405, partial [candidate division Zixibacteria bacterium]|nr:hypothetical protein [candidate division Zixibacteria bacterium]
MITLKTRLTIALLMNILIFIPWGQNEAIASGLNGATTAVNSIKDGNPPTPLGNDYYGTIDISWTAPGDDGNFGMANHYVIKYSNAPINDTNWDSASEVADPPAPIEPGQDQSFTLTGLYAGQFYYMGIKSYDEAGNASPLSNIAGNYATGIPQPLALGARVDSVNALAILAASVVNSHYSIYYEFALDTTISFVSPRIDVALTADTVATVSFGNLLPQTNYYWHCRAVAADHSDSSLWSGVLSFSLDLLDTQAPLATILSPSDGDTLATDSVTISWQAQDNGVIAQYYLGYTTDSGQNWHTITQGTDLNGSINWLVPQIEGPIEIGLLYIDQSQNSGGDSIIVHRVLPNSIDETNPLPGSFALDQSYPNPFNAQTTIGFSLPTASLVTLEIFDLMGKRVATLHNGQETAGHHEYLWQAGDLSSGTYLYRVKA